MLTALVVASPWWVQTVTAVVTTAAIALLSID